MKKIWNFQIKRHIPTVSLFLPYFKDLKLNLLPNIEGKKSGSPNGTVPFLEKSLMFTYNDYFRCKCQYHLHTICFWYKGRVVHS